MYHPSQEPAAWTTIVARMRNLQVVVLVCILSTCGMVGQQAATSDTSANSSGVVANTDDMPCGMIYGKDHFLSVCAPAGWILDNEVLVKQGIYATFYRKGFSYHDAMARHTVMYANVVLKDKGQQSAAELMQLDAEKTKRDSPKLVIQHGSPIVIPGDKGTAEVKVPVQSFLNGYQGSYETVAYIENDKTIVMLVISSASNELLQRDHPDFVKLVQSYRFIGSNVTIGH